MSPTPEPNLYVFSRTYEQGTAVRDLMDAHNVQDMTFKIDELFKWGDKTVIRGYWWRGYTDKLEEVRAALDAAGHPWFRDPEKVIDTTV